MEGKGYTGPSPMLKEFDSYIAQNKTKPEAREVEMLVRGYLEAILEDLQTLGRYQKGFQLLESGSFYENLRVGLPYEFDFMLLLNENVQYLRLDNQLRTCVSSNVFTRLISDLHECFRRRKNHRSLQLREFQDKYNRPNFCFYLEYKGIGVMVDLVPCLKVPPEKVPLEFDEATLLFIQDLFPQSSATIMQDIYQRLYLVPTEIHNHWRLSTSQVELWVMDQLSEDLKIYLRLIKYLCNRFLTQNQAYDLRLIRTTKRKLQLYGYKPFLPSYVLKLLFLKHLRDVHLNNDPWQSGCYTLDGHGILQALMKRLKEFKITCLVDGQPLLVDSFLFGGQHKIQFKCFQMLDTSRMLDNVAWFDDRTTTMELFLDSNWFDPKVVTKMMSMKLSNFPRARDELVPQLSSLLDLDALS